MINGFSILRLWLSTRQRNYMAFGVVLAGGLIASNSASGDYSTNSDKVTLMVLTP